jgi:hypothetical protein
MTFGKSSPAPRRGLLAAALAFSLGALAGCSGGGGGGGGVPAPTPNVSGTVVDANNNATTLNGIQVQLATDQFGQNIVATTTTANGGRFGFNNVAPGQYYLVVNGGANPNGNYYGNQIFGPFTVTANGTVSGTVELVPSTCNPPPPPPPPGATPWP